METVLTQILQNSSTQGPQLSLVFPQMHRSLVSKVFFGSVFVRYKGCAPKICRVVELPTPLVHPADWHKTCGIWVSTLSTSTHLSLSPGELPGEKKTHTLNGGVGRHFQGHCPTPAPVTAATCAMGHNGSSWKWVKFLFQAQTRK